MTATATQARIDIATALSSAGITAFASTPSTMPLPCVVLAPDSTYLELVSIGAALTYRMGLRATVNAPALSTDAALEIIEQLIDSTIEALPAGVTASTVSAPRLDSLGQGQGSLYVAEITISALIKKEQ
jgi:hypothetical protein